MMRVGDSELARVKRAFILWVQGIFKVKSSGDYRWNPNDEETQIYVAADEPMSESVANMMPRVIITLGPCSWAATSTSQRSQVPYMSTAQTFTDLLTTSVQMSISARVQEEADALALFIFKALPLYEADLNRCGGIHFIATNSMQLAPASARGSVVPGSPASEWRTSRVVIPLYVQIVTHRLEETALAVVREHIFSLSTS